MRTYRVDEVLTLVRRPVEVDPAKTYREIGIRSFGKGIFHKEPVAGATLGSKRVFEIHPGELVFSNVFAWEGAVAVSTDAEQGMIGSHRFMTYQVKPEIADRHYLKYYFQSEQGLTLIRRASPGSAGRNKTLGIDAFAAQEVTLPAVETQRRIARLLDTQLTAGSELEAAARQKSVVLPAALPDLIDLVIDRFVASRLAVSELVEIVSDTVHPGDDPGDAREFVGLEHIAQHLGVKIASRPVGMETGRKFRFRSGDVLYGYLRPYQNKVWIASHGGLCSVEQFVLRCDSAEVGRYLGYVLRGQRVLTQVRAATNNLQLPRLSSKSLLRLEIPVPPTEKLQAVLETLDTINDRLVRTWHLSKEASRLAGALPEALLNAAFSGKL